MHVWHLEPDTPLRPERVGDGEPVVACVGTWPIEPGQSVWASFEVRSATGRRWQDTRRGRWVRNDGPNSYWEINLGRFERGDELRYKVLGEDEAEVVVASREFAFRVEGEPAPASVPRAGVVRQSLAHP
jgi:hypothetical protein